MMHLAIIAALLSAVDASNWAVLVAGSKGFENYRHQADTFHLYQILLSKGFKQDQIITMAYDDVKDDPENPFPGQVFNVPDETGPGVDVRADVTLDYTGEEVTVANFVGVLLGNGTTGGSSRWLDLAPGDDVFVFYVDHGAPGILEFPDGDVLHATEFQGILQDMHAQGKYGRMVVYLEACESGSILQGLPSDLGIYGVTAVGTKLPSLGTYCGYEAVINGIQMGTCLGDLFAVFFMRYIVEGDGSRTMGDLFLQVKEDAAIYASLHYGHQEGESYGDVAGFQKFTLAEFFYPDIAEFFYPDMSAPVRPLPPFVKPNHVVSAVRAETERLQQKYEVASSLPLGYEDGELSYWDLREATDLLQAKLRLQERIQNAIWRLVTLAYPGFAALMLHARRLAWGGKQEPANPACEMSVHRALVKHCGPKADMTTAYAMQFHQVVVNLCADPELMWASYPALGEAQAYSACPPDGNDVVV